MSQPTTSISLITDMAESVDPQRSWIPLMKLSLSHQVMKKIGYVLPDTKFSIIYGPEVSIWPPVDMRGYEVIGAARNF